MICQYGGGPAPARGGAGSDSGGDRLRFELSTFFSLTDFSYLRLSNTILGVMVSGGIRRRRINAIYEH